MAKVSKEERLLKIKALQDELKILNEEEEPSEPQDEIKTAEPQQETVEDDDERGDCSSLPIEAIQKPKKKKQLTQKQIETLKKGNAILREKQAQMAREKAEKEILEKEVLQKKLIDKAIKLKKKQIKQNKILFESESESEAEEPTRIQKVKPVLHKHPAAEQPKTKLRFI
jgi:hypothetical protein